MSPSLWPSSRNSVRTFGRRDMFRAGGAFGLGAGRSSPAAPRVRPEAAADVHRAIGVRPVMNCRGVNTYIGGSLMLPEVKRAMDDASRQFVGLNELANGIGARLAELTGAETVPNEYLRRGATMGERRGLR